jgi:predicted PurR-regulated permease PerM
MFSLDDRTGNVITTVGIFMIAAAILYIARGALLIFVLSVLFAYLLEPAVTLIPKSGVNLARRHQIWPETGY